MSDAGETRTSPRLRRTVWLILVVIVAVLDLWTKAWWTYPSQLDDPGRLEKVLMEGWLTIQIRTVYNTGGVWSIARGQTDILLWGTVLAIPLVFLWIFWPLRSSTWDTCAKSLVLGGALGNLYDRVRFHGVRDFIDVHFGTFVYPTFNVADIALVAGIAMLFLTSWRRPDRKKRSKAA